MCDCNDQIIQTEDHITPMCAVIDENYHMKIYGLVFDIKHKDEIRNFMKAQIVKQKVKGYIVIFDTKMTSYEQNNMDKAIVQNAVIRTLYSPKFTTREAVVYEDNKIISRTNLNDWHFDDAWSLWNNEELMTTEHQKEYLEFKSKNPQLFKDGTDNK